MPAAMTRMSSTVDTGKLQPATLGVTVAAGQPLQIGLLAVNQVSLRCATCATSWTAHRSAGWRRNQHWPRAIHHGDGAHAAQMSADVVLEFSLACSSAARAGDVSARERSADESVILWSGSVSGARRSSHCCTVLCASC